MARVIVRRNDSFLFFEPEKRDCQPRTLSRIRKQLGYIPGLSQIKDVGKITDPADEIDFYVTARCTINPNDREAYSELLTDAMVAVMAIMGTNIKFVCGDNIPEGPIQDFNDWTIGARKTVLKLYVELLPRDVARTIRVA